MEGDHQRAEEPGRENNVEVVAPKSPYGGGTSGAGRFNPYGRSRFDEPAAGFQSGYTTPGWQRAKERTSREDRTSRAPRAPVTLEGELVASSASVSQYALGSRTANTASKTTAGWPGNHA